jgi:hypothetical protein
MSKNLSNHLSKTIGGVAAAMLSAVTIGGQVPVGTVHRDSTVTTTRVVVLQGRTDSIQVLAHRILQERYGSPMWIDLTGQMDSLIASILGNKLVVMRGGLVGPAMALRSIQAAKGYLGINAQGPYVVVTDSAGTQRYRFFAYQPIISVDLGSPADRAGIEPGDVLVGYNGIDLINHEFNFSEMLVPKKRVDVTVRRGGDVKDFALTVANAPEEVSRRRADLDKSVRFQMPASGMITIGGDGERPPPIGGGTIRASTAPVARGTAGAGVAAGGFGGGRGARLPVQKWGFFLSPNGLFGASLSNVDEDLAKVLRLRKGILVNSVSEETPAFRAGLRGGDVIVACNDDSVNTLGELRELVARRLADHAVTLHVVRQQKVKKLTISWPDSP